MSVPAIDNTAIAARLKAESSRLGFAMAGVCPAVTASGVANLREWLSAGYAGEMGYLNDRATAYEHPRHVLEGVRSMLMLAYPYRQQDPPAAGAGQGRVSRYAWGRDYHDVIHERLHALCDELRRLAPDAKVRGVVDSAPLLEREYAVLAGLGWVGKNTLVLHRQFGSWFFLAALLTDLELPPDDPQAADHCGTCTACLDACPTDAFVQPYVLDARRCISYLTIEHRSPVPPELRPGIGDWLFGCDICQDVCPWNHHAARSEPLSMAEEGEDAPVDLCELFFIDDTGFRQRFRRTPLWRPKRRGLLRNAAIVLGNRPTPMAIGALRKGLQDIEPLVRGACAWALGRQLSSQAATVLQERRNHETDADVLIEIEAALRLLPGVSET
ncbi:MAG: tRNA epoxyqueuosine(34) reductase QueG [Pirellulales bacterium]